jgi:hypothetical protein
MADSVFLNNVKNKKIFSYIPVRTFVEFKVIAFWDILAPCSLVEVDDVSDVRTASSGRRNLRFVGLDSSPTYNIQ